MMRVACIVDTKGKVQHNRIKVLKNILPDFRFAIFFSDQKVRIDPGKFQCIYYASYGIYRKHKVKHNNIVCSVTSHKCLSDYRNALRILKRFKKVSVNNRYLHDKISKNIDNVLYIPNGVDTDVFYPGEREGYNQDLIRLGWVGNVNRATKNFRTIVRPLKKSPGFVMRTIETRKSKRLKRSHANMIQFYNSIDFYVVTSSTEGTPNPALEAAACGVPIITTRVGNMPDLIRHGENGFFAKDASVRAFRGTLKKVKLSVDCKRYSDMSNTIRSDIVSGWTWESRAGLYRKLFTP